MCIFHKWTKWEQYDVQGMYSGGLFGPKELTPFSERRQKRHCEKCNKEQDQKVDRY